MVLFVPLEWVLVVASALGNPPVVISPVRAVSVTAGVPVLVVNAINPYPLVPAEVFVYARA